MPINKSITPYDVKRMYEMQQKGMTLREIEKHFPISYEAIRRRIDKYKGDTFGINITNKTLNEKPKTRHRSVREYDFLQYLRPVMRWGVYQSGLTRSLLEMILYLYPMGLFTKNDYFKFHRTISMYGNYDFKELMEKNFIVLWRPRKGNKKALYTLSNKAKQICARMHKFLTGEEKMPETAVSNPIAKDKGIKTNKYYMDIIKKMNKEAKV